MDKRDLPWVEKFRPTRFEDLVGNEAGISDLFDWVRSWKKDTPSKRGVLLAGPPGTGKTSVVGVVANEFNAELVEFNASDKRNKSSIETLVWRAATQQTLDGSMRIILLDEVDGLSGSSDRGGIGAIVKIIDQAVHPIIMTANDSDNPRIKSLLKKCKTVEFSPVNSQDIEIILNRIIEEIEVSFSEDVIQGIVMGSNGDIRAAIADLQSAVESKSDPEDLVGNRDVKRSIKDVLRRLFMTTDSKTARVVVSQGDVDYNDLLLWLDQNIHLHLNSPDELDTGFEALSLADLYLGRIMMKQNWKLLSYVYDFLSAGVATSRSKTPFRKVSYSRPIWPLLIWKGSRKQSKQKDLLSRLSKLTGVSSTRVSNTSVYSIEKIIKNSPKMLDLFTKWLDVKRSVFSKKTKRR